LLNNDFLRKARIWSLKITLINIYPVHKLKVIILNSTTLIKKVWSPKIVHCEWFAQNWLNTERIVSCWSSSVTLLEIMLLFCNLTSFVILQHLWFCKKWLKRKNNYCARNLIDINPVTPVTTFALFFTNCFWFFIRDFYQIWSS
jgi:hypothetical protein